MAAVLVALYDDYAEAERVRTELVADGFPTDRVELTSMREPGQAGTVPGESAIDKLQKYFATLFNPDEDPSYARFFADRVCRGASAVTVHPRGEQEVQQACEILERHKPLEIETQGLEDMTMERAAADHDRTVVRRVLMGTRPD